MIMETKAKTNRKVAKKTTPKTTSRKATTKKKVTQEQIKQRAYEIYVESGYKGTELENWLKAEKELK